MPTTNDIYEFLNSFAPAEMKMDFDNVGFLVGRARDDASSILVSLDITNEVISEALEFGAGLIVSHHPLFFSLKSVTDFDPTGDKIVRLLSGGISAICMHTNLDAARGGVNDALATAAGIADVSGYAELLTDDDRLTSGEAFSYGRVGFLKNPMPLREYLPMIKANLKTNGLRYHDANRDVFKIAVVGGSGGDYLHHAVRHNCDTFITADIKYNVFLDAKELGINLIDGDHFCTENLVTAPLAERLSAAFPKTKVQVSKTHTQPAKFY